MAGERVLIVENDEKSFLVLRRVLEAANYKVENASNGEEGLAKLKQTPFDVLLTDLNMLGMNGMKLIGHVRNEVRPLPLIIMITGYCTPEIRKRALETGAHECLGKPIDFRGLAKSFHEGLRKIRNYAPAFPALDTTLKVEKPSLVGVVIATSTGGPQTLEKIFKDLPASLNAAVFVVQHGPDWALRSIRENFERKFDLKFQMAEDAMIPEAGHVYIAPGDRHLCIDPNNFTLRLINEAEENYMRPAADPLFRTATDALGPYCIAVVLTGLGRDGTQGAEKVAANGGAVLAQSPKTAIAPFMPLAVIKSGIKCQIVPLDEMATVIETKVRSLSAKLGCVATLPR